jgi:hypothetical protein
MNPLFPSPIAPDNPLMPQQRGQFVNVPSAPQAPMGGMFGGGAPNKTLSIIAAMLNGFNAGMPGPQREAGLQGLQSLHQMMLAKQQEAQAQQKHQQDLQDQMGLIDYRQQHAGPDDFTQRVQALNALKPGLGDTYAQNYAQNGGGMGPVLVNPMTGQTMVPAAKAPAAAPPAEAIARLKSNPAEAAQFDEVFGPGASAKVLGGPTPSASGNFPGQ